MQISNPQFMSIFMNSELKIQLKSFLSQYATKYVFVQPRLFRFSYLFRFRFISPW